MYATGRSVLKDDAEAAKWFRLAAEQGVASAQYDLGLSYGSTIHTDGWEGYVGLEALGYRHEYDFLAGSSQSASELLPHVHRVAALLKRWLIGTHQGAVSREHLDYYLDEYTFRFNRRRSRHRGKLFYRLVQQAATVGPTTYSEMVQHLRGRRTGQPQDVG